MLREVNCQQSECFNDNPEPQREILLNIFRFNHFPKLILVFEGKANFCSALRAVSLFDVHIQSQQLFMRVFMRVLSGLS